MIYRLYPFGISSGGIEVFAGECLTGFIQQWSNGIRVIFQSEVNGSVGIIQPTVILVIVSDVSQVIGIHIDRLPRLD